MSSSDVPSQLKSLVRMVIRAFYPIDNVLVMDVLIRKRIVKEDDLLDLLKFDKKQLKVVLTELKKDKLINQKLKVETGIDNKAIKHNYFFVNYRAFVNVVKYKLDHINRRIQNEEREETSRSSFICTSCKKTFTDLETNQLMDMTSGELKCNFCGSLVDEDPDHLPKANARLVLAKFNDQFHQFYGLIREVEDYRLSANVLDPDFNDTENLNPRHSLSNVGPSTSATANNHAKENLKPSGKDFSLYANEQGSEVKIEDSAILSLALADKCKIDSYEFDTGRDSKLPIWMRESTIRSSPGKVPNKKQTFSSRSASAQHPSINRVSESANGGDVLSKEVLDLIIGCELRDGMGNNNSHTSETSHPYHPNNNNMNFSLLATIRVDQQDISIENIGDDHVRRMTPSEKENYVRACQHLYSKLYDF